MLEQGSVLGSALGGGSQHFLEPAKVRVSVRCSGRGSVGISVGMRVRPRGQA